MFNSERIEILGFSGRQAFLHHQLWFVGIAFELFGIDRLILFLGLPFSWDIFGVVLRIVVYLLVLFTLYQALVEK